jgi:phage terminase large subunit
MTLTIPSRFRPRQYQLPILTALHSGIKRAIWVAHRRCGKDVTIFNWCIEKLIQETQTCFYVFPSYAQAKKAIWDAITIDGRRILDFAPDEFVAQKNQQEMKIRFKNGSLIQLVGSDNIDSLMGTNPKIVVFSEYALQDPSAWDFIRPILRVNKGYAIFISTPRGKNHFYDMYRLMAPNREWFVQKLTIDDTDVLTSEDIDKERAEGMSEELIQQEYYCSFDRGIEGSIYGKLVQKMYLEERIASTIMYDPYKLVHTAWDLGWDDCTAIIFFQLHGDIVKIIDVEEHSLKRFIDYKEILDNKKYKYGTHLFPHDVESIDGLSTGCTRKEILETLGIQVTTVPKALIPDGIESVRALMSSRLFINSNNKTLIKCLEQYHYDWDEKRKVYSNKPVHDFSSHLCDALRYLAQGLRFIESASSIQDDYKALESYWGNY